MESEEGLVPDLGLNDGPLNRKPEFHLKKKKDKNKKIRGSLTEESDKTKNCETFK